MMCVYFCDAEEIKGFMLGGSVEIVDDINVKEANLVGLVDAILSRRIRRSGLYTTTTGHQKTQDFITN